MEERTEGTDERADGLIVIGVSEMDDGITLANPMTPLRDDGPSVIGNSEG